MQEEIKQKIKLLKQLYIYDLCDKNEINKINNAKSDIELENTARTLILKYL